MCDDRRGGANTVLDHINAFRRFSRHDIKTFNPRGVSRSFALDLDYFDVVVIHYSVVLSYSQYVSADIRDKLRRFRGLKVEFIQDDYRWVDRETAASRDIGIDVLFTVAPEPAASQLYDERLPGVRRVQTLTGYVPEDLIGRATRSLDERTIDVGYRARDLPFWYGRLSREKVWIAEGFLQRASAYGLSCDIAWTEHERIYGDRWIDFISSSRATLGTESGASIADFDGSAEKAVLDYLATHPAAPYEEVNEAVLQPYEGNVIVHVVSPRVFEAAALRTAMIMFPGDYSGVVRPDEHYIALEKDFSNMDGVVRQLRDADLVEAMTGRAYEDLIASGRWSYKAFVEDFDRVVDEEAKTARGPSIAPRYRLAQVEHTLRTPPLKVRAARAAHAALRTVFRSDTSHRFGLEYESQIQKGMFAVWLALGDRDLRPLLLLGRRSGAPIDRILREILEISLLRRAAQRRLPGQDFALEREFDTDRNAVSFVSVTADRNRPRSDAQIELIRDAMRSGALKIIEWDHRALGGLVQLDRPRMQVGIGFEGLENFTVLAGIGREQPNALERALRPLLQRDQTTLPVG